MGLRLTHKNALWVAVGKFWVVWVRCGLVYGKKTEGEAGAAATFQYA